MGTSFQNPVGGFIIQTKEEIRNALVYNCLENPKIILDETEYEYILTCIRDKSLNKPSTYTFTCDECEEDFDHEVKVSEITKVIFNGYKPIQTRNFKIELQDIQNRKFYEEKMTSKNKSEANIGGSSSHHSESALR